MAERSGSMLISSNMGFTSIPAVDDEIAWNVGALSTSERVGKLPKPEEPPPIGLTKFDGSFVQWFDYDGHLHTTELREAIEVSSDEPRRLEMLTLRRKSTSMR